MPDDDEKLVLKAKEGDMSAFEILVKRYMKRAYFIVLGFTGDPEASLDLSQDAFVSVFRSIKRFNPQYRFYPWFYKILKNLSLNHIRKRKKETDVRGSIPDNTYNPEVIKERDERKEAVWKAIWELEPGEREIIILKHFQNLTYKDIAQTLDCPLGTVMSRLYYARKKLREKVERWL